MKSFRIPLRAVLYKEGKNWIAHCLEFDVIGDGKNQESAIKNLCQAIFVQVEASVKHNCISNLFTPADGKFFRMFAEGTEVAHWELQLIPKEIDSVTIEDVETREYSSSLDSNPDLVFSIGKGGGGQGS